MLSVWNIPPKEIYRAIVKICDYNIEEDERIEYHHDEEWIEWGTKKRSHGSENFHSIHFSGSIMEIFLHPIRILLPIAKIFTD